VSCLALAVRRRARLQPKRHHKCVDTDVPHLSMTEIGCKAIRLGNKYIAGGRSTAVRVFTAVA
jgi:hypothetical protein